jgi:hypothetical protein
MAVVVIASMMLLFGPSIFSVLFQSQIGALMGLTSIMLIGLSLIVNYGNNKKLTKELQACFISLTHAANSGEMQILKENFRIYRARRENAALVAVMLLMLGMLVLMIGSLILQIFTAGI